MCKGGERWEVCRGGRGGRCGGGERWEVCRGEKCEL